MADTDLTRSKGAPLGGETVLLAGRLHGVTRRRLDALVRARGGRLVARATARTSIVAVGHSAAAAVGLDGRLKLPAGLPAAVRLVSENELRRMLGMLEPLPEVDRSLEMGDLEKHSGLMPYQLACLALFDVLEPVAGRFGYRDLVAAREAARLLARGIDLAHLVEAAVALRRRGSNLAETRLTERPSGELVRDFGGQIAELNGQLTMELAYQGPGVDELVSAAEKAEAEGDLEAAESLYRTAVRADPSDPVLPFNLGNVFDAQGRAAEARVAWRIAAARDPGFAESWYNLAVAAEEDEEVELAIAQYRRAVQARPDYADAHFNLALLLTRLERCSEALPCWDRVLDLEPDGRQAVTARRAAALCRMQIVRQQATAG